MKSKILTLAAVALTLSPLTDDAAAHSCVNPPAPREAYASAAAVFVGWVVEAAPQHARVEVEESFKGVDRGEVVIQYPGSGICEPTFRVGQRWLFYARSGGEGGGLYVPGADGTKRVDEAAVDLGYLRAPSLEWPLVGKAALYFVLTCCTATYLYRRRTGGGQRVNL